VFERVGRADVAGKWRTPRETRNAEENAEARNWLPSRGAFWLDECSSNRDEKYEKKKVEEKMFLACMYTLRRAP
jgi:hypothetical protein